MAQFTVSWDAYKQNICNGLSTLQQNGEFVDMTLAADGHHVKVHQLVMSLVSPYIKELITSAQCPHPVIFLNKISYATLCAILEYIYTGEVLVAKDTLPELVEAARELHIKGLEDMRLELSTSEMVSQATLAKNNQGQPLSRTGYFKTENRTEVEHNTSVRPKKKDMQDVHIGNESHGEDENIYMDAMETDHDEEADIKADRTAETSKIPDTRIQYTISNQGALQMILNRCMYYLRYTSRKGPKGGHRQWRCIDYVKRSGAKCPATVITKDDVVIKRYSAHTHAFHDKQIMKKVRDNAVYSAIHDAEALGESKKQRQTRQPAAKDAASTVKETDTE